MKKILLSSLMAAAAAVPAFAGVDNINYQAVIKNGSSVIANEKVELKFELIDNDKVVYSEEQAPTTNAAGFVSCQLGGDDALSTIEWGDLTLRVSINLGSGYEVISNEAVSSVPTALYALKSADSDEIKAAVEELMIDVESNKTSILGINAELVKFDGFIEDVDAFNTDLSEKLEPMMGLNYEEVEDQFERIHTEIKSLQAASDELNTNTDAFATMLETRIDKIQGQVDLIDPEVEGLVKDMEDVKNNVKELGADVAQIVGIAEKVEMLEDSMYQIASPSNPDSMMSQINIALEEISTNVEDNYIDLKGSILRNEQNISILQGKANENEEAINALSDQVEAAFDMNQTVIDKIQKQADTTDSDLANLQENLTNSFTSVEARLDDAEGQLENLNNISAVVRVNENAIEELQGNFQNLSENLTHSFTSVDAQIAEISGELENLKNFSTVVKEEYATNESVEAAFDMLQTVLDKMQKQLDSLEEEVQALKK